MKKRQDSAFGHRNLPLLLLQARETVFGRFRAIVTTHGLTEQQWRIIRALLEVGPMEPREIVMTCHLSSPSLAGILARMDNLGLVRRERMGHDQRRVQVSLTAKSRVLAAKMAPRIEATYAELEATLGREFVRDLYDRLDALVERLGGPGSVPEADE